MQQKPKPSTPSNASRELESSFPAFVANSASDDKNFFNTQLPDDMIAEQEKEYDAEEEEQAEEH